MLKEQEPPETIMPIRWLVGDDNESMFNMYSLILPLYGIQARSFADPEDVVAAYAARQSDYDLVLTDYNYQKGPDKTGFYVATRLTAITETSLPIVMCSGNVFKRDEQEKLNVAIHLVLPKPITIGHLLKQISQSDRVQTALRIRQDFYSSR